METITLRDYQQECVDIINKCENGSYLVCVATGLGKTVIFSHIERKGRMLILSHREELVWQPKKYFDCSYGVEQSDNHSNGEDVVSASVQSIVRRLDSFSPDDFDIIITDEAHHAVAETYRKIYDYFKPRLHLGFTATPNRADNVKLGTIFSKIIYERDLKWGIKHEYLSNIECFRVNVGYDISEVHKQCGDLNINELSTAVDTPAQNQIVADAYKNHAVGQTLIFATTVKHAENIAALIDGAVSVTADTPNRNEIIEKFTNCEIPCLVNCMVFTEGTDMPLIETIIIDRPTRNASLYTQMVGRGLRKHDDKKHLLLMDCVGVTGKLDICTAPDLFGIDKLPESVSPEDIDGKMITEIEEIIEAETNKPPNWKINLELVKLFEERGNYDTHNINYIVLPNGYLSCSLGDKWAMKISAEDIAGNCSAYLMYKRKLYQTITTGAVQEVLDIAYSFITTHFAKSCYLWDVAKVKKWGSKPASDSQISFLKKKMNICEQEKINFDDMTKYEASILIGRLVG